MTDNPEPRFVAAILVILEMRELIVQGCSRLDFEVSDKKIGTFYDLMEDLGVKKWTEKVWAAFLWEMSGIPGYNYKATR